MGEVIRVKEKFNAIEKNTMSLTVANQIIQMIADGKLHAGEKLPSERQLQEILKVGRPAVREALSALQIMHICETRMGDGTYVTSLDPRYMTKPFELLMLLSKPTLIELFDMREVLEVGAIRLAVNNLTGKELEELSGHIDQEKTLIDNSTEFAKVDVAIHSLIVNASNNSLIKNVMYSLQHMSQISRTITSVFVEVRRQSVEDHKEIVAALQRRDVPAAEESMRRHLKNVRMRVVGIDEGSFRDKLAAEDPFL